jgi:hypothetical protein
MRIEELKQIKDQRPFQPFMIGMADGREIPVRHPDAIAWEADEEEDNGQAEEPLTLVCVLPGGRWENIELALVRSLAFPPQIEGKSKRD